MKEEKEWLYNNLVDIILVVHEKNGNHLDKSVIVEINSNV
jgi:hypothetical protein